MITITYELYTSEGLSYGGVKVTGENEEDCQQQIDQYLDTLNGVSSGEGEETTQADSDEE